MPPVTPQDPQNPKAFKSQPWVLFDTVAARSFLMGDTGPDGLAIGSQVPAISASGDIVFFQSGGGRTRTNMPWYTNQDLPGQMAYGLQVWQIYVSIFFPTMPIGQSNDPQVVASGNGVNVNIRLAEAILQYGVLQLNLGQEEQIEWPLTRFGSGGGITTTAFATQQVQNSQPQSMNVMKLPEPIEMIRTQNMSAKIRLAPEVFALIGSVAAPGVGLPLMDYEITDASVEPPVVLSRRLPPYAIQLGLVGRRVKATQYGQLVRDPNAA